LPAGQPPDFPWRVEDCLAVVLAAPAGGSVTVARLMPPDLMERAGSLTAGLSLLGILRQDRGRVLQSYVVPFLLVYALLIMLALLAGAMLARRIARPVEALVAGTQQVAAGDLEVRVAAGVSGEVGVLVDSFNQMVDKLAAQRRELARLARQSAWRDLARVLAHEIKNPLTPILLAVQSVRQGYRGQDATYLSLLGDCEDIVKEEVERLRQLVREFSEFARLPEAGTPPAGSPAGRAGAVLRRGPGPVPLRTGRPRSSLRSRGAAPRLDQPDRQCSGRRCAGPSLGAHNLEGRFGRRWDHHRGP
jgi:nitrogen fixation/metabolism regulation signal transduction histidine kinase